MTTNIQAIFVYDWRSPYVISNGGIINPTAVPTRDKAIRIPPALRLSVSKRNLSGYNA